MQHSGAHRTELLPGLLHPYMHSVNAVTVPTDRRVGSWLSTNDTLLPGGIALIGFPCDVGVARNGGRPGAARAPETIRRALYRLTPDARNAASFVSLLERSLDLGDIHVPLQWPDGQVTTDDDVHGGPRSDLLFELQQRLGQVVESVLRVGGVPVVLGGGHETAFGHYLGSRMAFDRLTILNWDAHADVRPLINELGHSGSPFRQALDLDPADRLTYVVAGLQPQSVASDHLRFVNSRGRAIFAEELSEPLAQSVYDGISGPTQVSFDLDAVNGAEAPGVSAPSVNGLAASTWLRCAERAGRCEHVTSVDVVELNPIFDLDGRTARLAAATVWTFMRGVAVRNASNTSLVDQGNR